MLLALAPGELGSQCVQPLVPEALQPPADVPQWLGPYRVEPARALGPDAGEAVVPQDAQVLRDGRLGDAELFPDHHGDRARAALAAGEQLQDAPADGIAQDVERVHLSHYLVPAYISQARHRWNARR